MARLRDKENGCPWDVEQSFETIVPHTLEEAYEVADAIERKDMKALKEELGDLLLQVVFHAQMADEAGLFSFEDVAQEISDKLVRRHPHVFEGAKIETAEQQLEAWEAIKTQEKNARERLEGLQSDAGNNKSVLDDVPLALPALARAEKLQKRAARVGFDWPSVQPVIEKIDEELAELKEEIKGNAPKERLEEELGDLLFVCCNLARHLKTGPEDALRKANQKFTRRFHYIEAQLKKAGKQLQDSSLEEMDALWNEAKRQEKAA